MPQEAERKRGGQLQRVEWDDNIELPIEPPMKPIAQFPGIDFDRMMPTIFSQVDELMLAR